MPGSLRINQLRLAKLLLLEKYSQTLEKVNQKIEKFEST